MIEIGDQYFCLICNRPITWTGKGWAHETIEEHPPKPDAEAEQAPKHVALEVKDLIQKRNTP